jgi:hypothetical protein
MFFLGCSVLPRVDSSGLFRLHNQTKTFNLLEEEAEAGDAADYDSEPMGILAALMAIVE